MKKIKLKWIVAGLLFIATGLSFLDRQVLSVAIIQIQKELHITDVQYGWINTSFLVGYAFMFTAGGWLIDRYGSRRGMACSVGVWSVANLLHGMVTGFGQLVSFRFLLGLGEGGCFPGAARAVSEWFDKKERALANGIAIGGSAVGAVIAPPLTIWIAGSHGWRWSFVLPGIVGILWTIGWLCIRSKKPAAGGDFFILFPTRIPFSAVLQQKQVWVFVVIRFLLDPVLYFFMFWIPKYLSAERHVSFDRIGNLFWIPFLALGVSNIIGGWLSDRLMSRLGFSLNRSRKTVMGIAAFLTMTAPFIAVVASVEGAITLMAVILFAHGFWITNYITSISDVFGTAATSTVVGISGTAGALSALLVNPLIGKVVSAAGYTPLWFLSGLMYPLGFVLLVVLIPKLSPVTFKCLYQKSL
ncbi:MFS transporter [Niabella ginsenosidivorans]|uniref:MFS transporter n=1 Tax=Niabella ginsenosidivorans TaxID=1176587 RepID=A0A1A9I7N3_9BACT|nr:MFS transporter [Niabella ginsenosidivorans]ANH83626.1 MFS transporter [Niabella ginsenosidivorans]